MPIIGCQKKTEIEEYTNANRSTRIHKLDVSVSLPS